MRIQISALHDTGDDYTLARCGSADVFALYTQNADGTWAWVRDYDHLIHAQLAAFEMGDPDPELRSLDDENPREFWNNPPMGSRWHRP